MMRNDVKWPWMIRNAVKWWGITRMKWNDDRLHLRILFLGNAAKIRFRKTSKFPYHKILVHSLLIPSRCTNELEWKWWDTFEPCISRAQKMRVSFLLEEEVREARNTFPDVTLLRPWENQLWFENWEGMSNCFQSSYFIETAKGNHHTIMTPSAVLVVYESRPL